jgi:hypothetical protein
VYGGSLVSLLAATVMLCVNTNRFVVRCLSLSSWTLPSRLSWASSHKSKNGQRSALARAISPCLNLDISAASRESAFCIAQILNEQTALSQHLSLLPCSVNWLESYFGPLITMRRLWGRAHGTLHPTFDHHYSPNNGHLPQQ